MESQNQIEPGGPESPTGEEPCLALRPGEVLRASVAEIGEDGQVRLGVLGVQTWVRTETPLEAGQELVLLVIPKGDGIQLRILESVNLDSDRRTSSIEARVDDLSEGSLDPSLLTEFHQQIQGDEGLIAEARRRSEAGAMIALPLPAAPSGHWTSSRLYFVREEGSGEKLVLHLCPGSTSEVRIDLLIGSQGVEISAEAMQRVDLETLWALLPELGEALSVRGMELRIGGIRGGQGQPPAQLDLLPPKADGSPRLDKEV